MIILAKYVTKNDFVYKELKAEILEGRLRPGERLIVADLASRFEVSPMPIREALMRLQQEELVEIVPHTGARVATVNMKKFLEIVAIRVELETLAAKLATKHITNDQIAALAKLVEQMEEVGLVNDFAAYQELNSRFHELIYAQCQNQQLFELIMSLWEKSKISRSIFSRLANRTAISILEHKQWLESIMERDEEKVTAVVRQHKENAFKALSEVLEKDSI